MKKYKENKMAKSKVAKVITIGSVVSLKSGGPNMTVVSAVSGAATILTVLWAVNDRVVKAEVPIQAFRLVR
jgi:uncharacterized membrane protein